jgi:ribosomal protein S1
LNPVPPGWPEGQPYTRVGLHRAVKVKVTGHDPNGLFVQILGATGRQSRGFITAAGTGTPRGTDLRKAFALNTELEAKVIEMDPRRNEVKLSIKALAEDTERNAYKSYRQQVKTEAKFGTLGDLLKKSQERK